MQFIFSPNVTHAVSVRIAMVRIYLVVQKTSRLCQFLVENEHGYCNAVLITVQLSDRRKSMKTDK